MNTENRQLEGWKEIASHLDRTVRTVQGWEKDLGLPVVRIRNRVSAQASELDRWLARQTVLPSAVGPAEDDPESDDEVATPPAGRHRWQLTLIAVALASAAAMWAAMAGWPLAKLSLARLNPVIVRVDGLQLIALDRDNREVWRFALPSQPTAQKYSADDPREYQRTLFTDLDGDGRNELLYVFWPVDSASRGTTLFCIRPNGELAWTFKGGRPLPSRSGQTLSATYNASLLGTLTHPRADGGRIIVGSHHPYSWPYQIALLDINGHLVAEYIHPGWLMKLAVVDLDQDGVEELVLGGVNNSHGYGPTLVVLDSRHIAGLGPSRSEQGPAVPGLVTDQEAAVLLFPPPDEPSEKGVYYRAHRVRWTGDHLEVGLYRTTERPDVPNVTYQLDRRLRVTGIFPNNVWEQAQPQPASLSAAIQAKLSGIRTLRNRWIP